MEVNLKGQRPPLLGDKLKINLVNARKSGVKMKIFANGGQFKLNSIPCFLHMIGEPVICKECIDYP